MQLTFNGFGHTKIGCGAAYNPNDRKMCKRCGKPISDDKTEQAKFCSEACKRKNRDDKV